MGQVPPTHPPTPFAPHCITKSMCVYPYLCRTLCTPLSSTGAWPASACDHWSSNLLFFAVFRPPPLCLRGHTCHDHLLRCVRSAGWSLLAQVPGSTSPTSTSACPFISDTKPLGPRARHLRHHPRPHHHPSTPGPRGLGGCRVLKTPAPLGWWRATTPCPSPGAYFKCSAHQPAAAAVAAAAASSPLDWPWEAPRPSQLLRHRSVHRPQRAALSQGREPLGCVSGVKGLVAASGSPPGPP